MTPTGGCHIFVAAIHEGLAGRLIGPPGTFRDAAHELAHLVLHKHGGSTRTHSPRFPKLTQLAQIRGLVVGKSMR